MINYPFIVAQVDAKGDRKKFMSFVLGDKANRAINYFENRDVTLSTLERISEYLGVPIDMLSDRSASGVTVAGNNNNVGNVNLHVNLIQENNLLREQIKSLQDTISAKNETIQALNKLAEIKS